jgi:hypothetical protein
MSKVSINSLAERIDKQAEFNESLLALISQMGGKKPVKKIQAAKSNDAGITSFVDDKYNCLVIGGNTRPKYLSKSVCAWIVSNMDKIKAHANS